MENPDDRLMYLGKDHKMPGFHVGLLNTSGEIKQRSTRCFRVEMKQPTVNTFDSWRYTHYHHTVATILTKPIWKTGAYVGPT